MVKKGDKEKASKAAENHTSLHCIEAEYESITFSLVVIKFLRMMV